MDANERIDFSRYRQQEEISRQLKPDRIRPQAEREASPDYYQRRSEREGNGTDWSGSKFGGGIWNGRSR